MKKQVFLILLLAISCNNSENGEIESNDHFAICTEILGHYCSEFEGEYCLFGYKWGGNERFTSAGMNAAGPMEAGGVVTFSFQEKNGVVHTHRQVNVPSESFDIHIDCAKEETIKALQAWSKYADIEFRQQADNSDSDIKIFSAYVNTGGIGFPNIEIPDCAAVAGQIILDPSYANITTCKPFFNYALHEIGHTLGLGHSARGNIMGDDILSSDMDGLQAGDIKGIIEIYGNK